MTILVTGGAGFIGSHIVARYLHERVRVRVLDNFSTGKLENLSLVSDDVEVVDADVRDYEAVLRASRGVEIIFHQAAIPSVPKSFSNPHTTMEVGVTGTINVLEAARAQGCRRVVLASSSAVYGDSPELPKREDMSPKPLSPYAISKLSGEQLLSVYFNTYGLEAVALRYFNVYGPRQDPNSEYAAVVPKFMEALQTGRTPRIFGDGEQSRDFVHIDDVVNANVLASTAPSASGEVFNVATQRATTVNQVLQELALALGGPVNPEFMPERPGDIRHSIADITKAQRLLGFRPVISLREGISSLVGPGQIRGETN